VTDYAEKQARLLADLGRAQGSPEFGLVKSTSNLFRDRAPRAAPRVDVRHFDAVIAVDPAAGTVDAEGMTRFVDLAAATLARGTMPAVVPQLKSITVGGAVAGVGIEATSFRRGLVHDAVVELDVLTGDGRIVTCSADNEHRDLFHGFANSYGTLGYALRVKMRTLPVKPFVRVDHQRFSDPVAFFAEIKRKCTQGEGDFLDGVVFGRDELVLSSAQFVDIAPFTSDYTFERIYYRSLRKRSVDFLTAYDYLWRWDTDWFWCSKNVGAQNPVLRHIYGRDLLSSITYQKIMRWNTRWGLTAFWNRFAGIHAESVIQDVDIPIARATEFLAFFHDEIGILPIWICPIRAPDNAAQATFYRMPPGGPAINFGFWDVVKTRDAREPGHFNRKVERKVTELGGIKSLYSDSYYPEDEFWQLFDRNAYRALKARYDPAGRRGDLYGKTVLKH
jgi:FAD/FMN-containing dehydrogenase